MATSDGRMRLPDFEISIPVSPRFLRTSVLITDFSRVGAQQSAVERLFLGCVPDKPNTDWRQEVAKILSYF
jgi:hypothetical protein